MCKHAPNLSFDVRSQHLTSDGVSLKRIPFDNRGIKTLCTHENKYLAVATFTKVQTVNAPSKVIIDQGFNPNLRNMAPDYKYTIELYNLPGMYKESEEKTKPNWKELS